MDYLLGFAAIGFGIFVVICGYLLISGAKSFGRIELLNRYLPFVSQSVESIGFGFCYLLGGLSIFLCGIYSVFG